LRRAVPTDAEKIAHNSVASRINELTSEKAINLAAFANSSQAWLSSASSATMLIFEVNSACERARQEAR
jgi:hypothetical protein